VVVVAAWVECAQSTKSCCPILALLGELDYIVGYFVATSARTPNIAEPRHSVDEHVHRGNDFPQSDGMAEIIRPDKSDGSPIRIDDVIARRYYYALVVLK
jgi:hypothetical protein